MQYNKFHELQISSLGMGNMRLPTLGSRKEIDHDQATEMIAYAIDHGVNYFDTGYGYHEGSSEPFIGKALKQYARDTWYIATKFPGHMMEIRNGIIEPLGYLKGMQNLSIETIFENQLQRLGLEYIDFYLLHNLCETSFDFYTNEHFNVIEYLLKQKQAGRIRHLGFSAHGRAETIQKFLETYDCFEFAQIQLNYLDWILQDAKRKYEVITAHDIPVIVMEPLRGGRLAQLPEDVSAPLRSIHPENTDVSWAFRFLQGLPNILTTLSGMSTLDQVKDNVNIFSKHNPLSENENKILLNTLEKMINIVPCTACGYCQDDCPKGLNIPKLISMYNEAINTSARANAYTLNAMRPDELPGSCIGCGACQKLCPQNINISDIMRHYAQLLN